MQHKLFFVSLLGLSMMAASCNVEKSDKYQTLLAERDSLYAEAIASKGGFDEALNTINEIENALEEVRAQENIILMADNQEGNVNTAVTKINAIQQTLKENRAKINELEKKLAEQGAQSKALNQTVSRLKQQLEEKDIAINALKGQLQQSLEEIEALNEQVSNLNENINDLNNDLDAMSVQNAAQKATIENQDAALNTVWVCVGTTQTLKDKGVVDKKGLFRGNEISKQGFDNSQFTQVDKRELSILPLNSKSVTVMTTHPDGSYSLVKNEEDAYVLYINDKEAFWSMSNYLVVSIK